MPQTPMCVEFTFFCSAACLQFAADWEAARVDKEQGSVLTLPVLRSNRGRLILKYNSLQGFVPYPLLSPTHWCKGTSRDPRHFVC
jgi:hypothetical protein